MKPKGDADMQDALLFYARHFLCQDFSKFGAAVKDTHDFARIYLVTSGAEEAAVLSNDPDGVVFNLADYIGLKLPQNTMPSEPLKYLGDLHAFVWRDRFMRRMSNAEIDHIRAGLHRLLQTLEADYKIVASFDETVSGFLNEAINKWVTAQGGIPNNFHPMWVPGYSYFSTDNAIRVPTPVNMLGDCSEIVENHIAARRKNQGRPVYVRNYSTWPLRLRGAALHLSKALYRRFTAGETFLDNYYWPNLLHGGGLLKSLYRRYDDADQLDQNQKYIVFALHFEPEAVLNYYSTRIRQEEIVTALIDQLPANTCLLIKEHPSQIGALHRSKWDEIKTHSRVKIIRGDYPMTKLFELDMILVSIASTAIMDGVIHEKPVYVIGEHFIRDLEGIGCINDIHNMQLSWEPQALTANDLSAFFAKFMERHCFAGQFIRGNRSFLENHKELLDAILKARVAYQETLA